MPNQLPKNQNQNSFNNEKHLNLLDNLPSIESGQDQRITNFIFFISVFLSIGVSFTTYLNLTSNSQFKIDEKTQQNIDLIKSRETYIYELNSEVEYLKRFKEANQSIKVKQSVFYSEVSSLLSFIGNPNLELIQFNQVDNQYSFKIIFFYSSQNIEEKIKEFQSKNPKLKSIKLETIERIDENKEIKYTFVGEIDGR